MSVLAGQTKYRLYKIITPKLINSWCWTVVFPIPTDLIQLKTMGYIRLSVAPSSGKYYDILINNNRATRRWQRLLRMFSKTGLWTFSIPELTHSQPEGAFSFFQTINVYVKWLLALYFPSKYSLAYFCFQLQWNAKSKNMREHDIEENLHYILVK
jgi:hypothetical protein